MGSKDILYWLENETIEFKNCEHADKYTEANRAAEKAVKTQIPRKPFNIGDSFYCECGQFLCKKEEIESLMAKGFRYCPSCGQKIDWVNK